MGFGGREEIDGGHEARNLSLDEATRKILDDAEKKGKKMAHVVEKCVKTMADQFDPGPACGSVWKVVGIVDEDLDKAKAARDYPQVQALAQLRNDLEPFANLCEFKPPQKPQTKHDGVGGGSAQPAMKFHGSTRGKLPDNAPLRRRS